MIILILIQFLINNLTIFYVDLLGMVGLILLLSGNYTWGLLIIISLLADLLGHWYLGSHLLGLVLISFITKSTTNFYKISSRMQRIFIANIFWCVFTLLLLGIELVVSKIHFSLWGILVEVILLLPVIQFSMESLVITKDPEYIAYE